MAKYGNALESFDKAIDINPDNPGALAGRGSTLRFLRRYEDAAEALEKFMKKAPEDLLHMREEAWAMLLEIRLIMEREKQE
jgi:tetratricopeptide (TPR) repeat protein